MTRVQQPVIPLIGQWIAEQPGVLSLAQGIAHYSPPSEIMTVLADRQDDIALHRYAAARGIPELLDRIEAKVQRENATDLTGRKICCTAGSNMGFLNAISCVANVGDEIVLLTPYYFNHHMAIEILGCQPVCIPTDANYQIDVQRVADAITDRTRAVVTVSPNNPSGAVYPANALHEVNQICLREGIFHIHDEAYEYFVFGDEAHVSPSSFADSAAHTISLFSLSKAYAMAGWRIGYMVYPAQLESAVHKVQDTNLICPPIACQRAACIALDVGRSWCDAQIKAIRSVREPFFAQLRQIDDRCQVNEPAGAFYALLTLSTAQDDLQLVKSLVRDYAVATLPGSTFGITESCVLRLSYGGLQSNLVLQAVERLTCGLRRLL